MCDVVGGTSVVLTNSCVQCAILGGTMLVLREKKRGRKRGRVSTFGASSAPHAGPGFGIPSKPPRAHPTVAVDTSSSLHKSQRHRTHCNVNSVRDDYEGISSIVLQLTGSVELPAVRQPKRKSNYVERRPAPRCAHKSTSRLGQSAKVMIRFCRYMNEDDLHCKTCRNATRNWPIDL